METSTTGVRRTLTASEEGFVTAVRDAGLAMARLLDERGASRELSLAKTNLEQAVMWGVKHVTG